MSKSYSRFFTALALIAIFFYGCSEKKTADPAAETAAAEEKPNYGGYETLVVLIATLPRK